MGSGKSHWGKIWSQVHHCGFIDLDEQISLSAGRSVADIFATDGEDAFRLMEAASLRNMPDTGNWIVACGGGTPCFHHNLEWMQEHGLIVYLEASPLQIMQRLQQDEVRQRPLLNALGEEAMLDFVSTKLLERQAYYQRAQVILPVAQLKEDSLSAYFTGVSKTIVS